jgi:hypothetical protein
MARKCALILVLGVLAWCCIGCLKTGHLRPVPDYTKQGEGSSMLPGEEPGHELEDSDYVPRRRTR